MTRNDEGKHPDLDEIVSDIQGNTLSAERIAASARRVWQRLELERAAAAKDPAGRIEGCADFLALAADYRRGQLDEPRRILLEDHLRECVACRKAFGKTASGIADSPSGAPHTRRWSLGRLAAVAATLAGVAWLGMWAWDRMPGNAGESIRVQSAPGGLYKVVSSLSQSALAAGDTFSFGQSIRAGHGGSAFVELPDGSVIELAPRAQISVEPGREGTTVRLERGDVILEAAKQRGRKLYVATDDCLVSVTGTVFSVNTGTKGSRISVFEGEVEVDYSDQEAVLHPGDQLSTNPAVGAVPLEEEIAWSRKVDEHLALLDELLDIGRAVKSQVSPPPLRHETRLLDLADEKTRVYVAIPNVSRNIVDAFGIIEQRAHLSPMLSRWWQEKVVETGFEPVLRESVERLGQFGKTLGPELVLTMSNPAEIVERPDLTLLAEAKDPQALRALIEEQTTAIERKGGQRLPLHFVEDPFRIGSGREQPSLWLWISGDLLVASTNPGQIGRIARLRTSTEGTNPFLGTEFYGVLRRAYRDGTTFMVAADLRDLIRRAASSGPAAPGGEPVWLSLLGLKDLEFAITERKTAGDLTTYSAILTFAGERQGLAGVLAEPGPMGSMDYISSDATLAAAALIRQPRLIAEEWIALIQRSSGGTPGNDPEAQESLDLVRQLAGSLGGEIAVALDGPLLPSPAWKLVLEVNDPLAFQSALAETIERIRGEEETDEALEISLGEETVGSRPAHVLRLGGLGLEVHYVFTDGYVLAAGSRASLATSLQTAESGARLTSSPAFRRALPADAEPGFSALVYESLAGRLGPLLSALGTKSGKLNAEQRRKLRELTRDTPPTIAFVYAEPRTLRFGQSSPAGALDAGSLLTLLGAMDLPEKLIEPWAKSEQAAP